MMGKDFIKGMSKTKPKLVVFFIVDVSESMNRGGKIDALNAAMGAALNDVRDFAMETVDSRIFVSVLQVGTGADGMGVEWINREPYDIEKFDKWEDVKAGGWTPMSKALIELNRVLSREVYLDSPSGSNAPIIIYMTDGIPAVDPGIDETDVVRKILEDDLNNNGWYKHAIKSAISIGDDANVPLLEELVGNPQNVISASNPGELKKYLSAVALTSSMISSKMKAVSDPSKSTNSQGVSQGVSKSIGPTVVPSGAKKCSGGWNTQTDPNDL